MKNIIILGSTGSIGTQTLDVIRKNRDKFNVSGLLCYGTNLNEFVKQICEFSPEFVAVANEKKQEELKARLETAYKNATEAQNAEDSGLKQNVEGLVLKQMPKILFGSSVITEAASAKSDLTLNALAGDIGLEASYTVLSQGVDLALANKESLIAGGKFLLSQKKRKNQIVPVDSEHSAIAQSLLGICGLGETSEYVQKLILTCSGGPFIDLEKEELKNVTPEDALKHPNWDMGKLVTVNSSTLVNKGLELIEAAHLFGMDINDIDVVIHRQSLVHSGIKLIDGSMILEASYPDMKIPISIALNWPERLQGITAEYDFSVPSNWTFEPLDSDRFPAVRLAANAFKASELHPAVYNAANEIAVKAFCDKKIGYNQITETIEETLLRFDNAYKANSFGNINLDVIKSVINQARKAAENIITSNA